jgi:hypothetical protein
MGTTHYNPGDTVWKAGTKIRGMVGWVDDDLIYVCWEVGYEAYKPMGFDEVEPANILDLIVEERETEYQFCPTGNRCRCGRKTHPTRYGPKCDYCNRVG